ncbi:MAG: hypothetical protein ABF303_09690, partial [Desulfobacterales bacterium]
AAHIEIRVGGCNAVDDPKDKQDVELFLAGALKGHIYSRPELPAFRFKETMQLFNIDIDLSRRDAWYVSATSGGIPIHTGVAPTVDSRLRTFGELGP